MGLIEKLVFLLLSTTVCNAESSGLEDQHGSIREKRETYTCETKYHAVSPDHSACLNPPAREEQGAGYWRTRRTIIKTHNKYRGNLGTDDGQPIPTNMMRTVWDWELSKIAEKWAQTCIYQHDESYNRHIPARFAVGQNIARTSTKDWALVMSLWWSEIDHFSYGVGSTTGEAVGHYTQMAWASSNRIGCGYALCNETDHFFVCNYGPAGNVQEVGDPLSVYKPYQTGGSRGSACPASFVPKYGYCDCLGRTCNMGGVMDSDTCTCQCAQSNWVVPRKEIACIMTCRNVADNSQCESMGGSSLTHDKCLTYYNLGYQTCPIMCKWCPMEDGSYWEPGVLLAAATEPTEAPAPPVDNPPVSPIDPNLSPCTVVDLAKCGQPDMSGYWPTGYCIYSQVEDDCPAMCRKCLATSCVSHSGDTYTLNEEWVNPLGRFTCTAGGVTHEQGCDKDGTFVASESSYAYEEGFTHWTCTCTPTDGGGHILQCTGE